MRNLQLFYHTVTAQVVIVLFILIKILLVPYLVWRFLGATSGAMVVLDVATIVLGTLLALSMGMVGYYQARHFERERMLAESLWYMLCVHGPAGLFLLYKWLNGGAWDTQLLLVLSGWLSMFSHPMNLVGFYGPWVDGVALLAMAGCYLLGVFVFHDEHRHEKAEPMSFQHLRVKGRLK
ncbi:hypothetical protein CIG75_10870 [Tumebacillus algifaecis]|uniref:Uncharacterized protein n=1 Tax=Tumebacillus algifaecis TaxID=1214604 RepID=A0A223D1A9_9BACL|nr:hypothetical protein [Tumebacillus algifaecis]ASS75428.1 hypothetical protein CIG75_10870 [Tumebacillus algifaecis]